MNPLFILLAAIAVICATAFPSTPPTSGSSLSDGAFDIPPLNTNITIREAEYEHGFCSFHAIITQNCCLPRGNLLANPAHCGYIDIASIKDGKGNDIPGLGGDMGKRVEIHHRGSQEIGPTKTITGMEKTFEYKWYEWSAREKMTYRYGDCYWDEGASDEPGTYSGQCADPKPHCNRGAWTANGVCAMAGHPYRRTHDMDCWFPC